MTSTTNKLLTHNENININKSRHRHETDSITMNDRRSIPAAYRHLSIWRLWNGKVRKKRKNVENAQHQSSSHLAIVKSQIWCRQPPPSVEIYTHGHTGTNRERGSDRVEVPSGADTLRVSIFYHPLLYCRNLKEEVYVKQPPGFHSEKYPNHVYFLDKALYGLKQSPKTWYERLSNFLLSNQFHRGTTDITLFYKHTQNDIMLAQIYVDDIILGSTDISLCKEFESLMQKEFEMSMMGELTFFLGLQSPKGIFINQAKYVQDVLKKYKLLEASPMRTPMATSQKLHKDISGCWMQNWIVSEITSWYQSDPKESHMHAVKRILRYLKKTPSLGLWYPLHSGFDLLAYTDSDYGGCQVDRKSTSGSCHFLGGKLVSWSSKKQNCVSTSTVEAEYVAAASCCSQALWMQTQLRDYGYTFNKIPILCDNKSAIVILENPVQHSKTKHIDIRYHFLKHQVEEGNVEMYFVNTEFQLADLFTKALDDKRFTFLIEKIGMTGPLP
ncbi:hypothetical protein OSB04_028702 [Centaurea solstitialis]|uniref:Reverse transcriptase Ty1/copia-type domain-containing protein n=1 Tax=Centaurea solstitialis TaxID=347529 RepID=A0AA38WBF9_9ASTR|nr:hypothetical protein OSB04_028702 [Centaurea solstitialis]